MAAEASVTDPVNPARARRQSAEVQQAILQSARKVFARKGYGAASVREIAEHARVYEPTIYRRFETKARLFEAAVLDPLQDVISGYLNDWDSLDRHDAPPSSTEDLVRAFMPPLYQLMCEDRELILALMSAEEFHSDEIAGRAGSFSAGVRRLVDRMRDHVAFEADRRPLPNLDPARALLISFGLVLGLSLLEGSKRADGREDLGGEQLVEEMVKFTLFGVSARPTAPDATMGPENPTDLAELFDRVADAERRAVRAEVELMHLRKRLARFTENPATPTVPPQTSSLS